MDDGSTKLFDECAKCGGTGTWTRAPERTGNSTVMYGPTPCPDCQGTGMILTAGWRHLHEYLRRLKRVGRL